MASQIARVGSASELRLAAVGDRWLFWNGEEEVFDPHRSDYHVLNAYLDGELVGSAFYTIFEGTREDLDASDYAPPEGPYVLADTRETNRFLVFRSAFVKPEARGRGVFADFWRALSAEGLPLFVCYWENRTLRRRYQGERVRSRVRRVYRPRWGWRNGHKFDANQSAPRACAYCGITLPESGAAVPQCQVERPEEDY